MFKTLITLINCPYILLLNVAQKVLDQKFSKNNNKE